MSRDGLLRILARSAGRNAGRLIRLFRVDGRPGSIPKTRGPVALVELEQRLERLRPLVHPLPRVTFRREPRRHARDRQLVWVHGFYRLPGEGRRHLGARAGAHRPGAEDGLMGRVLVVVDEDAAAALLLPPGGGDELGAAALKLASGGDCCSPMAVRRIENTTTSRVKLVMRMMMLGARVSTVSSRSSWIGIS